MVKAVPAKRQALEDDVSAMLDRVPSLLDTNPFVSVTFYRKTGAIKEKLFLNQKSFEFRYYQETINCVFVFFALAFSAQPEVTFS
ncbi:MAG: hypothetical protein EBY22_17660 [Gammaproteobacteria bacterium]|nr:hypothetical protein [Gammaproteobacteria bacterium]